MATRDAPVQVLYEDNHLLAVYKPAGVPTMGGKPGVTTLLDLAKEHVRVSCNKPGNVYLGVVSRLDAPVTGVVLLARTSKAAARLTEAFRSRSVEKTYLAIVSPPPADVAAQLVHYLRHDDRHRRVHVTTADAPESTLAELSYELISTQGTLGLLRVRPITGRKHQIRVQLAHVGSPVVGDIKYGAPQQVAGGIRLHAWRLTLEHPVRKTPLTLEAVPPKCWPSAWRAPGGASSPHQGEP